MSNPSSSATVWNERIAIENADGCVTHLKELLEIFLRQSPQLLLKAEEGLAANDGKSVLLAAHTLKGSLQILGSDAVAITADALEAVGRSGQLSEGAQILSVLQEQLHKLTLQITEFMNKN